MIEWISATRWRMPGILLIYFFLHAIARSVVSPSLDYDESEQVFLSQCLSYGYNSQPPLYTWVQTAFFELLGYSVFSLAALKNLLLCGTYLLVFASVRKATDDVSLGAIATIGLLTIPQISWESHRDLSHTVAVTFATMLTFYSVVGLAKDGRSRWYVLIGFATAVGILSKYNFAIVIVGLIVAGLTVPAYRRCLHDWRMGIAVCIAAAMILPHAIWMGTHLELISSKTLSTLAANQSNDWFENVSAGFTALAASTLGCCAITLATFFPCVHRHLKTRSAAADGHAAGSERSSQPGDGSCDEGHATTLLLERFLIAVTIMLCLLVLSGHALEFKNRWIQPFIVLLPAYFVLRLRNFFPADRKAMNNVCAIGMVLMCVILTAVITRPLSGNVRNKYCWLNMSYNELAASINRQVGNAPAIIVASDMRIAGNLRLHFPESRVLAEDQTYIAQRIVGASRDRRSTSSVIVVTDKTENFKKDRLMMFAQRVLQVPAGSRDDWRAVDVDYRYGTDDAQQKFFLHELRVEQGTRNAELPTSKTR